MNLNRREFVAAGLAGVAGLAVSGFPTDARAVTPTTPPDEDGYKLWLRYVNPGKATERYRRNVREIRVDGSSSTCTMIRDEVIAATSAMLGNSVQLNTGGLQPGTVIVGTPKNSGFIRDLDWSNDLGIAGDEGFVIRST